MVGGRWSVVGEEIAELFDYDDPFDDLAEILSDSLLASYLLGIDHVSTEVRSQKSGVRIDFADSQDSPDSKDSFRMGFDVTPREAVEYFRKKKIVSRKEFDGLAEDARAAAFTVAGVYRDDVLTGFKDEITKALETGASQQATIKRFREILDGAGHRQLGAFHLETVFRTNMQMAYGVGRRRALESVADDLSYWQYHAVMDDRVRPSHAALNGLILPADHEFWNDHYPPWGFNCRCSVTATDEIPDDYQHNNPSGEAEVFYDEKGNPAKAEIGTTVIDLAAEGTFQGVPPQGGLKAVIQAGAARAKGSSAPSATPVVKNEGPLGKPVSQALKVEGPKAFKAKMSRATKMIDSVHGDGELPEIPLKINSARSRLGGYWRRLNGQALKIDISRYGESQESTALHEVGHFLDHQGITKGSFASISDPRFAQWRDAVKKSEAVSRLGELSKQPVAKTIVNGQEVEYYVDRKFLRYLSQTHEVWARSYTQYIAVKTGDPVAIAQLKKLRERKDGRLYYPAQWDDEDFQPIFDAIENLLRLLGWMK